MRKGGARNNDSSTQQEQGKEARDNTDKEGTKTAKNNER